MAVRLWAAQLNRMLTQQEEQRIMLVLPEKRRERLLRMKYAEKRREPLCAYWLLHAALKETYPFFEKLPEMEYGAMGKPAFVGYPDIHFNLSHTEGAVLVGLSDAPLGVDIEKVRAIPKTLKKRWGISEPELFFQEWTKREARVKRIGAQVSLRDEPALADGERVFYPQVIPGYTACVCTTEALFGEIRIYTMDELLAISADTALK